MKYTIKQVNELGFEEFTKLFGNVVENCSLVAISVWALHPFQTLKHLHEEICKFIDALPKLAHEGILRSHPDLAGRLAEQNLLTTESTMEQKAAQLNTLTPNEKSILTNYNRMFKEKFGFPFVICARENKKDAILKGLQHRVNNGFEAELKTGIDEVKKICYYRIAEIVED